MRIHIHIDDRLAFIRNYCTLKTLLRPYKLIPRMAFSSLCLSSGKPRSSRLWGVTSGPWISHEKPITSCLLSNTFSQTGMITTEANQNEKYLYCRGSFTADSRLENLLGRHETFIKCPDKKLILCNK